MNCFQETGKDRPRVQSCGSVLRRASLFAVLILFAPLTSYGYSWYSGASVGSNGIVYGWGVTDATQMPMYHVAYVSAKLTSPKGRQAYPGQISNAYTVRQDVSLSFDPTDLGTYYVSSLSSGFCYICHCWLFQYCGSYGSVPLPTFNVAYSSYIPVDNVSGPTGCNVPPHSRLLMIYMGDANRGTYRTTESLHITPDGQSSSGFSQDTGSTRNYGQGSPVNGSTLSQADEDGVPFDCYLWNNAGKATPAFVYDVSYPYAYEGQVHYSGASANPLEQLSVLGPITWDMRAVINATSPLAPTAYVNYDHTCYPSHQIKVNGQVVYLYTPPENDLAYITGCLTGIIPHVTGQNLPVGVPPQ